ncbi:MAG: phenol hydroxylase subunit P4 [Zavarzinia sp.]|nr:phenol hydroxylase subunit P4 [Zavarzinia sp.]
MTVSAISRYEFKARDRVENFHGNQIVYWHWEEHLMFCAPIALPMPPSMPFRAALETVLPGCYGAHPDWSKIDWSKVTWMLDSRPFKPNMDASLAENNIGHKSVLRFWTPGLQGIDGIPTC